MLRARLERMLEGIDARRDRVQRAMSILDDGGSVNDARAVFSPVGDARLRRSPTDERPGGPDGERGSRLDHKRAWATAKPGSPGDDERLSDEDLRELRTMIANHLPSIDEGLTRLEKENPDAARVIVERLAPSLLEVEVIRAQDGELAAIRLEEIAAGAAVVESARGLRAAGDDANAHERAEADLRQAIERQYEARARGALHEIIRMEQRLAELRREFEDRRTSREEEIDKAVERITARARRMPPRGERWRERGAGRDSARESDRTPERRSGDD